MEQSDDHSFWMWAFGQATASTNDSIKPCLFFQSVFVNTFTKHKKPVGVLKSKSFIFPFLSAYLTNKWTYFLKVHNAKVCITLHEVTRNVKTVQDLQPPKTWLAWNAHCQTNLILFPTHWKFSPLFQWECQVLYTSHGIWMPSLFYVVMVFHQNFIAESNMPSWCNIVMSTIWIRPTFHCPHFTLGMMITSPYHHYGQQSSQTWRQFNKHTFTNWFYKICIMDWESTYKQPF